MAITYPNRNSAPDDETVRAILATLGQQRVMDQGSPLAPGTPRPDMPQRFLGTPSAPVTTAPPPVASTIDGPVRSAAPAEPGFITSMETLSRNQPVPDLSDASYDAQGQMQGQRFPTRNPQLPPTETPTLAGTPAMDSTVLPPLVASKGPSRKFDPSVHGVTRRPGESDEEYNADTNRAYRDRLKSADPTSKVTKVDGGIEEAPPIMGAGPKRRAGAAGRMVLRNMNAGSKFGVGGTAGASIVSALFGLIAPGLEAKIGRQEQINAANTDVESDQEALNRSRTSELRDLQLKEAQDMPQRREAQSQEQQRDNLRAIWASLPAFDPQHNPEHKALQDQAAALGEVLLSKGPKPGTAPKTGLENAITVADATGNKYYVDKTTGRPIPDPSDPTGRTRLYAAREKPQPITPDLRAQLQPQIDTLQSEIEAAEKERDTHATNIDAKNRMWEAEAKKRQAAARKGDPTGQTVNAKRSLKDWIEEVRNEDSDYAGTDSKYDYSVRQREELATTIKTKRDELKAAKTQLAQQDAKPRKVDGPARQFVGQPWYLEQWRANHPGATPAAEAAAISKAQQARMRVIN